MNDDMPEMLLLRARGEGDIVMMGDDRFDDLAALVGAHPALAKDPLAYAKAASHFAQGVAFEVIEDPTAFAEAYKAQVEAEVPGQPWQQGTHRLRDFGIPDFETITPPKLKGDTVVFFVRDTLLGVPYEVNAKTDGTALGDDAYNGLPLSPVPGEVPAAAPDDEPMPTPADADDLAVAADEE